MVLTIMSPLCGPKEANCEVKIPEGPPARSRAPRLLVKGKAIKVMIWFILYVMRFSKIHGMARPAGRESKSRHEYFSPIADSSDTVFILTLGILSKLHLYLVIFIQQNKKLQTQVKNPY